MRSGVLSVIPDAEWSACPWPTEVRAPSTLSSMRSAGTSSSTSRPARPAHQGELRLRPAPQAGRDGNRRRRRPRTRRPRPARRTARQQLRRRQLIKSAPDRAATEFLVGLGGSATDGGGTGMLTALGAQFTRRSSSPARRSRTPATAPYALDPRLHHARIRPGMGCRRIAQYASFIPTSTTPASEFVRCSGSRHASRSVLKRCLMFRPCRDLVSSGLSVAEWAGYGSAGGGGAPVSGGVRGAGRLADQ